MSRLLLDYLEEFITQLKSQLLSDQARWGDTWKNRPIGDYKGHGDQVDRIMARYQDYYDQYKNAGTPMPWMKVVGEALIAWVRETYPNTYKEE